MSIAKWQVASLQAMGIDVYLSYSEQNQVAAIANKPWFNSLISLLQISENDCEFSDALPINFDPINKKLTLPFTVASNDAALKREIWQSIQADVEGL